MVVPSAVFSKLVSKIRRGGRFCQPDIEGMDNLLVRSCFILVGEFTSRGRGRIIIVELN